MLVLYIYLHGLKMKTIIKTKKGIYILKEDTISKQTVTIKADAFVSNEETLTMKEALTLKNKTIVLNKRCLEKIELENKKIIGTKNAIIDGDVIVKGNSWLENICINGNLVINFSTVIINCKINGKITINNPSGFILLKNNILTSTLEIKDVNNDLSLHIEDNKLNDVIFKSINANSNAHNITIFIKNNIFNGPLVLTKSPLNESDAMITIISNMFNKNIVNESDYVLFVDNNIKEISHCLKYTGYDSLLFTNNKIPISNFILNKNYTLLPVENIPQYVSFENDPALKTGCEATSCAILLSFLLNEKITKGTLASFMSQKEEGTESFWKAFIGDIYNDGYGCMSPVSVKALEEYLKYYQSNIKYKIYNLTSTPLYQLLKLVEENNPVIIWTTMGNDEGMYHRKYGSTKWEINNKKLYWPGRDHSLVIVGYNILKQEIYLADPEVNSFKIRTRNIYELENRFSELYSQSIVVKIEK